MEEFGQADDDEDQYPAQCSDANLDSSDDEDLPDESVEETITEVELPITQDTKPSKKGTDVANTKCVTLCSVEKNVFLV